MANEIHINNLALIKIQKCQKKKKKKKILIDTDYINVPQNFWAACLQIFFDLNCLSH